MPSTFCPSVPVAWFDARSTVIVPMFPSTPSPLRNAYAMQSWPFFHGCTPSGPATWYFSPYFALAFFAVSSSVS